MFVFDFRSLKEMLSGLCWYDSYTVAQSLEHRWPQAKVPGSLVVTVNFFFRHFTFASFPQTNEYFDRQVFLFLPGFV